MSGKLGRSLRNLVYSKSSKDSNNNTMEDASERQAAVSATTATAAAASSSGHFTAAGTTPGANITPMRKSGKKVRLMKSGSSRRNFGSDLEDIIEPSATAKAMELQRQLSLKQSSMHAAMERPNSNNSRPIGVARATTAPASGAASPKRTSPMRSSATSTRSVPPVSLNSSTGSVSVASNTSATPPAAAAGSAAEMKQRLEALQAMIEAGKQEMGLLQGTEAVKIQKLVRGFIARQRMSKQKPQQQQKQRASNSSKSNPKNAAAKAATTAATTNKNKKNRRKNKAKTTTPTKEKQSNKNSKNTTTSSNKPSEAAAATNIQALARGMLQRQRNKKKAVPSPPTAAARTSSGHSSSAVSKSKKEKSRDNNNNSKDRDLRDRYTWDRDDSHPGTDRYEWETRPQQGESTAKGKPHHRRSKSSSHPQQQHDTTAAGNNENSGSSFHNKRSNKAATTASTKAKRLSSIKSRDGSKKDQHDVSMKDHSMSFEELERAAAQERAALAASSGSMSYSSQGMAVGADSGGTDIVESVMAVAPETLREEDDEDDTGLFEDRSSSSNKEEISILSASQQRSFRSTSIASPSMLSKLTEDGDDDADYVEDDESGDEDFGGSLTSVEDDFLRESRRDTGDALSSSVMATAPKKHSHAAGLTGKDRKHPQQQKQKRQQRHKKQTAALEEDALSVSMMAIQSRRSDGDIDSEGDSDASELSSDESQYQPKPKSRRKEKAAQDALDDSVMAYAEMSDLDADTEFDLDDSSDSDQSYFGDQQDDHYFDESVMAVAAEHSDFEGGDDSDEDNNPREDDLSITSCESQLPKERPRHKKRRGRRREQYDDHEEEELEDEDEVMEAEDVSVLSVGSAAKNKKSSKRHRNRSKHDTPRAPMQYNKISLLPNEVSDESDEEELLRATKKRPSHRKPKRGMAKSSKHETDSEEEKHLQERLDEVNRLIAESQKQMEDLMESEATKIQSFVRMHRERTKNPKSPLISAASSRKGTKPMQSAAVRIQSLVRCFQARVAAESQRKSRKRTRRTKKRRANQKRVYEEFPREDMEVEQDEEDDDMVDEEAEREAMETEQRAKAIQLQALTRGYLQRMQDLLNPERVAAIKIQRLARPALRMFRLRRELVSIAERKAKDLAAVVEKKETTIKVFNPGNFDSMDTISKMINYLKKQIEKENEASEKWVTKIKALKEANVKLRTDNSNDVCRNTRLEIDLEERIEKRNGLLKINQQWIDGIKEKEREVAAVNSNIKLHRWQQKVAQKYIDLVAKEVEERCSNKKLVKEITFLAKHSGSNLGGAPGSAPGGGPPGA